MPSIPPGDAVALWFTYLRGFQAACSFNTNVPVMDLLTFANSTIASVLKSSNQQNQFIVAVADKPGFDLSVSDLTTNKTFEALLDKFNPLATYVGLYLQSLAAKDYPAGSYADFLQAPCSQAFPGGSKGNQWQTALGCMTSVIPAACFTPKLQTQAGQSIDSAQKKMSEVASQIAVLG
jgi:hypothetical protein